MTRPRPYNLTIGEDGLTVRCKWDAHYITDEQLEMVRKYIEMLHADIQEVMNENEQLEKEMMIRCGECVAMLDCDECLRADADHKARKVLAYENTKLRELVRDMLECDALGYTIEDWQEMERRMHELGIEID